MVSAPNWNLTRRNTNDFLKAVDLVTEIDKAVEELVHNALTVAFPEYKFLGEESYVPGESELTDEPTFILDPIDGTTNFIHSYPSYCISLGFALNKKPTVGVVYNPVTNQLFSAIKGKGAYLNGTQKLPLTAPRPLKLQSALLAIEWGSDRTGNNFKVKTDTFKSLAADSKDGGAFAHGFRSAGSAALNISYAAAGYIDAYWEGGCWAWDVCAGWIILEEAGGIMAGGNKGEWHPAVDSRLYFAVRGAEPAEQKKFVEDFWGHIQGTLDYKV